MRRPTVLRLGLGLALVLAAGAWLLGRGGGDVDPAAPEVDRAPEGAPDPARLHGRPDAGTVSDADPAAAASAPVEERRVLRGRLVTEDGDVPRDPRAWLVPKGSPGFRSWHEVAARPEVGDDGTWTLETDPRGQWIAALAAGYRPAFVDGDAWRGEEVVQRLERGRRIEVSVSVETDGVEPDVGILVHEREKDAYDYPGPGSEPAISTHAAFAGRGTAAVYASMRGRVRVFAGARGFVSVPDHVDLGPEEDHAAFHLCLGCRLDVRVQDAETGFALEDDVRVQARRADAGEGGRFEPLDRFADGMEYRGVPPGAWRVAVVAEGYVPWVSDVLDLVRPGQRLAVAATLAPAPGAGRLLLEVLPPPGGTLEGAELSALLGRRAADGSHAWERCLPRGRSADRRRHLLTPVAPGEIRLLVWTGPVATGGLEALRVEAGATRTLRLPLVRGTCARLLDDTQRTDGAFLLGVVPVTVRAPDGAPLPAVWFESRLPSLPGQRFFLRSSHDFRDELVSGPDFPRTDAVLGPYPFETFAVEGARAKLVPNER